MGSGGARKSLGRLDLMILIRRKTGKVRVKGATPFRGMRRLKRTLLWSVGFLFAGALLGPDEARAACVAGPTV